MFGANELSARTKIERWKLVSWQYIIATRKKHSHWPPFHLGSGLAKWMYQFSCILIAAYKQRLHHKCHHKYAIFNIFRFKCEWSKNKTTCTDYYYYLMSAERPTHSTRERTNNEHIIFSIRKTYTTINDHLMTTNRRDIKKTRNVRKHEKWTNQKRKKKLSHKVFRTIVNEKQDRTKEQLTWKIRWCSFEFVVHKIRVELIVGCLESNYYFDTMDYDIRWITVCQSFYYANKRRMYFSSKRTEKYSVVTVFW